MSQFRAEPTKASELGQTMPAILISFLSLSLSRNRRMRTAAANPARAGSILVLVGAMTGNSDKCARRPRRHGARENAIPSFLGHDATAFFFCTDAFFHFSSCLSRAIVHRSPAAALRRTLRNASLNGCRGMRCKYIAHLCIHRVVSLSRVHRVNLDVSFDQTDTTYN